MKNRITSLVLSAMLLIVAANFMSCRPDSTTIRYREVGQTEVKEIEFPDDDYRPAVGKNDTGYINIYYTPIITAGIRVPDIQSNDRAYETSTHAAHCNPLFIDKSLHVIFL
jgi:hypothetical protein